MLPTIHQSINKYCQITIAICTAFTLTGCETSDSSLLDLETLFPQEVITATLPDDQLNEIPSDQTITVTNNTGTGTAPDTDTNINTITTPIVVTDSQIPLELALLTEGEILTESRFGGTGDPVQDSFSFSISDYELTPDGELGVLQTLSGNNITICTYIFLSTQYMCLRSFDLNINDRVWHLFTMQSRTNGSGIFEFCTIENTEDDCLNKLIENPDGTTVVTITSSNTAGLLPDASPYFSYENQAIVNTRSSEIFIDPHYIRTMNSMMDSLVHGNNEISE